MYNQNSDLMKQEKFMLRWSADELSACQDSRRRHTPI